MAEQCENDTLTDLCGLYQICKTFAFGDEPAPQWPLRVGEF